MLNNPIGCALLLAVIKGVGIAFGRRMAENTAVSATAGNTKKSYCLHKSWNYLTAVSFPLSSYHAIFLVRSGK